MACTIPPVREIVIVISDFYLPPASPGPSPGLVQGQLESPPGAASQTAFPGIEHIARFGEQTVLEEGWRPWLARWLGRGDLAHLAPAVIAADGVEPAAPGGAPNSTTWIATPVHLIAGLTSLHLDRRSILRLSAADLESFAQDFNRTFGDTSLRLTPLAAGDFLMQGPATLTAATTEPARALVADVEASLPKGNDAKAFKRLGAELEMWLHAHPLNETRRRRGELPVSTLWLWGGGEALVLAGSTPTPQAGAQIGTPPQHPTSPSAASNTSRAFGNDPYLTGLWRLNGDHTQALPAQLTNLLSDPTHQRAVLVTEVTSLLQLNPPWTVLEALAEIDRRFVSPAITALGEGVIGSIVLIANDTQWRIRRRDRLKFWRRPRPGISALQSAFIRQRN